MRGPLHSGSGRLAAVEAEVHRTLVRWAAEPEVASSVSLRARVILALADGNTQAEAATRCGTSEQLVGRWRRRFEAQGLSGLLDRPRAGSSPRFDPSLLSRIRDLTLDDDPPDGNRWTTRSLARSLGISQSSVARAWQALEVGYGRKTLPGLDTPPPGIWGQSEVAGMYLAPPERLFAVRVWPDAPPRRARPASGAGVPSHVRMKVLDLVAEAERSAGQVGRADHVVEAWRFLDGLAEASPDPWEVHLLFAGAIFKTALPLRRWLRNHARFHLHAASERRTWSESIERWCSCVLSADGVRMRHRPVELLEALRGWLACVPPNAVFAWSPPPTPDAAAPVRGERDS